MTEESVDQRYKSNLSNASGHYLSADTSIWHVICAKLSGVHCACSADTFCHDTGRICGPWPHKWGYRRVLLELFSLFRYSGTNRIVLGLGSKRRVGASVK